MEYTIKITKQPHRQMLNTVNYISRNLLSPETAFSWLDSMKKEIKKLDKLPRRYPLTEEIVWHNKGVRKMLVGNHFIYYWIDESKMTVWIVAVIYARSDQLNAFTDSETN